MAKKVTIELTDSEAAFLKDVFYTIETSTNQRGVGTKSLECRALFTRFTVCDWLRFKDINTKLHQAKAVSVELTG
jgi:hypothetical protein